MFAIQWRRAAVIPSTMRWRLANARPASDEPGCAWRKCADCEFRDGWSVEESRVIPAKVKMTQTTSEQLGVRVRVRV
jgi:hypothetical protein